MVNKISVYFVTSVFSFSLNNYRFNKSLAKQMYTDTFDLQKIKPVGQSFYVLSFLFFNHNSWHCHLFVFRRYKWQSFEKESSYSHTFAMKLCIIHKVPRRRRNERSRGFFKRLRTVPKPSQSNAIDSDTLLIGQVYVIDNKEIGSHL